MNQLRGGRIRPGTVSERDSNAESVGIRFQECDVADTAVAAATKAQAARPCDQAHADPEADVDDEVGFDHQAHVDHEAAFGDEANLVTAHNMLRQFSRGQDNSAKMHDQIGSQAAPEFFDKYLDSSKFPSSKDKDRSDEWYHMFGMASVAFVSTKKGATAAITDIGGGELSVKGVGSSAIVAVGSAQDLLRRTFGISGPNYVAAADAMAEQAMYGIVQPLLSKGKIEIEKDEWTMEMVGAHVGTTLAGQVED